MPDELHPQHRYDSVALHQTPTHSSHPSPPLAPTPSTWETAKEDIFQSPAQIDQMLNFCKSCASVTTNMALCDACTNVLYSYDRLPLAPAWN
jgi:hypothetical protein